MYLFIPLPDFLSSVLILSLLPAHSMVATLPSASRRVRRHLDSPAFRRLRRLSNRHRYHHRLLFWSLRYQRLQYKVLRQRLLNCELEQRCLALRRRLDRLHQRQQLVFQHVNRATESPPIAILNAL